MALVCVSLFDGWAAGGGGDGLRETSQEPVAAPVAATAKMTA